MKQLIENKNLFSCDMETADINRRKFNNFILIIHTCSSLVEEEKLFALSTADAIEEPS